MPILQENLSSYVPYVYPVKQKVVISGKFVEVYKYEKPYFKGFPRLMSKHKIKTKERSHDAILELRADNIRRSAQKIRRLVNSNEKELKKMLTLTFSDNLTDLKIANKKLDIFLKKLRRDFPHLKYVAVPEFQKRGAIHYHILLNIKPYISNDDIAKKWGNGWAWFKSIYNCDNLGAYISKYLTKGSVNSAYFGQKKFFTSKNLKMPLIFDFQVQTRELLRRIFFLNLKPKFDFKVLTEFLGFVEYKQYVLT